MLADPAYEVEEQLAAGLVGEGQADHFRPVVLEDLPLAVDQAEPERTPGGRRLVCGSLALVLSGSAQPAGLGGALFVRPYEGQERRQEPQRVIE